MRREWMRQALCVAVEERLCELHEAARVREGGRDPTRHTRSNRFSSVHRWIFRGVHLRFGLELRNRTVFRLSRS